MNILAIETSSEQLGVALVDETRVRASYELLAERPHAIELPGAVTRVLEAAGVALPDVEAVAVDIGPGSFTGLRIGVAFVKALAFAHQKPVVAVPSLAVLAAPLLYAQPLVCPLLDAKQHNVYTALYQTDQGRLEPRVEAQLISVEDFLARLPQQPVLFLGDGVRLYRDRVTQHLGERALFAEPDLWLPKAATLGRLGRERFCAGQRDDPASLVPMYLYPHTCTIRPALL